MQRNISRRDFGKRLGGGAALLTLQPAWNYLAAAQTLAPKRGTIDFIFIDGDHSYDACKADIVAWTPFVKRGGVVAFHDFGSRADGVTRAIFEEIKAGRFAEIVGVAGTIIAFRM